MHARTTTEAEDRYRARAALYGLYLREIGYPKDEAAARVIERYPRVKPWLEKLAREADGRALLKKARSA